jgi:hypothetical protein
MYMGSPILGPYRAFIMDLEKHHSIKYLLLFRQYVFHYLFIFAYFKNTFEVLYNVILSKLIKFEIMKNKIKFRAWNTILLVRTVNPYMHQNP